MPGEFQLTGSASQLIADGTDVGTAEDLAALAGIVIKFTSNIPINKAVPIPGGVMYVPPRTATVLEDGQISEDGVNPGITLLADDPALELTAPLQWTIDPGRAILAGKTVKLAKWTFNAPAPADDHTLDELTPVPGITQPGGTRGPRGYPVDDVQLVSGTGALSLSLGTSGDDVTATVTTTGEDTIQFKEQGINVGAPVAMLVASPRRIVVDPVANFGAVGDGSADDTAPLQAALDAAGNGGMVQLPIGKQFKYTGTLTVPGGVVFQGPGRREGSPSLIAGAAGALITLDVDSGGAANQAIRDLYIEGNDVGRLGLYIPPSNRASVHNCKIRGYTQAGLICDGTQNADFHGLVINRCGTGSTPSGWPATFAYLIINGATNLRFTECYSDGGGTSTNYSAIGIGNIFAATDARFQTAVPVGITGNMAILFEGGIHEYFDVAHPLTYRARIFGGPDTRSPITFRNCGLTLGNTSIVNVSGYDGQVVFEDMTFGTNDSTKKYVTASTGKIVYRGSTSGGIDDHTGLREGTVLTGTATVHLDEHCRQILLLKDRRFDTGIGNWATLTGATPAWDSTKKRLSITGGTGVNDGAYVFSDGPGGSMFYNTYSQQYRLVRVRCFLSDVVGTWKLAWVTESSPFFRDAGASLVAGENNVVVELQGPGGSGGKETGVALLHAATGAASCKVAYIDVEHVAG